ncbi:MAG: DUF2442 domain-containing protein [Holophagaceae bacterium]|jgi:hypothetical protein|nr:DUF2442 domain-containing protein [Holophagaceae bacterium]
MLQPKITSVEALPDYKLKIVFETGEQNVFDVTPYIKGSSYGKLKDENYFKCVRIVYDGWGIEWKDGQDIAPHELYGLYHDGENGELVRRTELTTV